MHNWRMIPQGPRYTAFVLVLWVGLLIYIVARGDPLGYVIVGIIGAFIVLPALIVLALYLAHRRRS